MSNPSANTAPAEAPQPDVAGTLGAQLLAALPTLRLQSVCLLDPTGEALWLSAGLLGPDEQACIRAARATLSATNIKAHTQELFGDNQGALFLAIRTAQGQLAGMVMLLMDARTLGSGNLAARILTSAMRDLLQQAALTLEPAAALTQRTPMLLQEFTRLHPGVHTRRFKASPEDERQRGNAVFALEQLLTWMRKNPAALQGTPLSFTIAISGSALKDEQLPAKLASLLDDAPLSHAQIGFEVRETVCIAQRPQVERLLAWCERTGCFAVIDDFCFDSAGLDLLRSSAVKLLKVDAKLGSEALRDKLSQARVVAIVQAAKILGLHCVAKYIDSKSGRNWLAAVGFDFAQSIATEPLERLSQPTHEHQDHRSGQPTSVIAAGCDR